MTFSQHYMLNFCCCDISSIRFCQSLFFAFGSKLKFSRIDENKIHHVFFRDFSDSYWREKIRNLSPSRVRIRGEELVYRTDKDYYVNEKEIDEEDNLIVEEIEEQPKDEVETAVSSIAGNDHFFLGSKKV